MTTGKFTKPSQGGEAIDVVAYRGKDPDGGEGFVGARWPDAFGEDCIVEPLMTVAQHNRIIADVRSNRDAVLKVMRAKEMLPKCTPSIDAEILDNYARMFEEGAERNAELVELLRNKFPRIDPCEPVPLDEKAHCCEYTIYVERERLHRMIDAKLASLL